MGRWARYVERLADTSEDGSIGETGGGVSQLRGEMGGGEAPCTLSVVKAWFPSVRGKMKPRRRPAKLWHNLIWLLH